MTDVNTNAADTTNEAATETAAVAKPVPTKAERITSLEAQIKRLQERLFNVINDIVAPARIARVVTLPNIGDEVLFSHGRKTATTDPVLKTGTVVAIKPEGTGANGKKTPSQIKVQCGTDFDAEFLVIYPAQVVPAGTTNEQLAEDSAAAEAEDAS